MGTVTTGSFDEIQDDLGGSNPIQLSEYYRESSGGSGSTTVPNTSNNSGVPKSGAISVADISSVDGGTAANDVAYNSNPYVKVTKSTSDFTGQELSASCSFSLSVGSQGYSTADGDGNKPSNTGVTWSGSGITFNSTTATSVTATITASGSYSTGVTKTAYLSSNGTSTSVSLSATTRAVDLDPTLTVTSHSSTGNDPDTSGVTSGGSTVGGLDSGQSVATSLNSTLSNAAYKINSGSWITGASTVSNGDVIYIKMDSGDDYDDSSTRTVTVGSHGDTYSFTVSNRSQDTTPDDLTMPADYTLTGASLNTSYQTGTYSVSGLDSDHNGNLTSSGTNGIVISDVYPSNGDTIVFSQTSSASPRTEFTGTATMSNMSGMTDTTHSYSITTGDTGIQETGTADYSPSYWRYDTCDQHSCIPVSRFTLTRTLKAQQGSGYIAFLLYDTISNTLGTNGGDSSQWVWQSTYYTANTHSDIDTGDTFQIEWIDTIFNSGSWTGSDGSIAAAFGGSFSSGTYTSATIDLSAFTSGSTVDVTSRTRTFLTSCECSACMSATFSGKSYYVRLKNISGTNILNVAPATGSGSYKTSGNSTYYGMCF